MYCLTKYKTWHHNTSDMNVISNEQFLDFPLILLHNNSTSAHHLSITFIVLLCGFVFVKANAFSLPPNSCLVHPQDSHSDQWLLNLARSRRMWDKFAICLVVHQSMLKHALVLRCVGRAQVRAG